MNVLIKIFLLEHQKNIRKKRKNGMKQIKKRLQIKKKNGMKLIKKDLMRKRKKRPTANVVGNIYTLIEPDILKPKNI